MEKIIVDVPSRGIESAYVNMHFNEGKKALEESGYRLISLQENARLRIQEGKDAYVSQYGNWTREGFIYVPNKGKFFTKNSPIMENSKKATDCHRNGKEFYLTEEQVEVSLKDSLKLPNKDFSVPTNRFREEEITAYAFGDSAQDYGYFLGEAKIKEMPVWMVDNLGDEAFARQAWFHGLVGGDGSALDGYGRNLDFNNRVRGVRESAEGTSQKSLEVENYNLEDIQRVLKSNGLTGIEKILIDGLRQ
jgi:hypothetical protein